MDKSKTCFMFLTFLSHGIPAHATNQKTAEPHKSDGSGGGHLVCSLIVLFWNTVIYFSRTQHDGVRRSWCVWQWKALKTKQASARRIAASFFTTTWALRSTPFSYLVGLLSRASLPLFHTHAGAVRTLVFEWSSFLIEHLTKHPKTRDTWQSM